MSKSIKSMKKRKIHLKVRKQAMLQRKKSMTNLSQKLKLELFNEVLDEENSGTNGSPFNKKKKVKQLFEIQNLDKKYGELLSEIIPNELYLGRIKFNKSDIVSKKIKTILNCAKENIEFVNKLFKQTGVKVAHFPLDDTDKEKIYPYFSQGFEILKQKENYPIAVVCLAGKSRSSSIVISYIMKKYQMNFRSAYKYVLKRRKLIEPNENFVTQLLAFEKELIEKGGLQKGKTSSFKGKKLQTLRISTSKFTRRRSYNPIPIPKIAICSNN